MALRLEIFLFTLLTLFLPAQLGYHFWPAWSQVSGIRVDFLSPTIYLTDILILLLLGPWFFRTRPSVRFFNSKFLVIMSFIFLNIIFAFIPVLAFYKWVRVLEYYLLFKYLTSESGDKFKISGTALSAALIWTSLLAWAQLLFQHSVGGPLYWLGERAFDLSTPGIARVSLGQAGLLLRPYATLPHPNSLAGFLLVGGLLLLTTSSKSFLKNMSLLLVLLTLPFTFSRGSIITSLVLLSIWLLLRLKKNGPKIILILFIIPMIHFVYTFIPANPLSQPERSLLTTKATALIFAHPLLGIGLNNFIPSPSPGFNPPSSNPYIITQPVHNIYLLIAAELGLPATFILSFIIIKSLRELLIKNANLSYPIMAVTITGLVDHYWLTLHQNMLLLTLLISLTVVKINAKQ